MLALVLAFYSNTLLLKLLFKYYPVKQSTYQSKTRFAQNDKHFDAICHDEEQFFLNFNRIEYFIDFF